MMMNNKFVDPRTQLPQCHIANDGTSGIPPHFATLLQRCVVHAVLPCMILGGDPQTPSDVGPESFEQIERRITKRVESFQVPPLLREWSSASSLHAASTALSLRGKGSLNGDPSASSSTTIPLSLLREVLSDEQCTPPLRRFAVRHEQTHRLNGGKAFMRTLFGVHGMEASGSGILDRLMIIGDAAVYICSAGGVVERCIPLENLDALCVIEALSPNEATREAVRRLGDVSRSDAELQAHHHQHGANGGGPTQKLIERHAMFLGNTLSAIGFRMKQAKLASKASSGNSRSYPDDATNLWESSNDYDLLVALPYLDPSCLAAPSHPSSLTGSAAAAATQFRPSVSTAAKLITTIHRARFQGLAKHSLRIVQCTLSTSGGGSSTRSLLRDPCSWFRELAGIPTIGEIMMGSFFRVGHAGELRQLWFSQVHRQQGDSDMALSVAGPHLLEGPYLTLQVRQPPLWVLQLVPFLPWQELEDMLQSAQSSLEEEAIRLDAEFERLKSALWTNWTQAQQTQLLDAQQHNAKLVAELEKLQLERNAACAVLARREPMWEEALRRQVHLLRHEQDTTMARGSMLEALSGDPSNSRDGSLTPGSVSDLGSSAPGDKGCLECERLRNIIAQHPNTDKMRCVRAEDGMMELDRQMQRMKQLVEPLEAELAEVHGDLKRVVAALQGYHAEDYSLEGSTEKLIRRMETALNAVTTPPLRLRSPQQDGSSSWTMAKEIRALRSMLAQHFRMAEMQQQEFEAKFDAYDAAMMKAVKKQLELQGQPLRTSAKDIVRAAQRDQEALTNDMRVGASSRSRNHFHHGHSAIGGPRVNDEEAVWQQQRHQPHFQEQSTLQSPKTSVWDANLSIPLSAAGARPSGTGPSQRIRWSS